MYTKCGDNLNPPQKQWHFLIQYLTNHIGLYLIKRLPHFEKALFIYISLKEMNMCGWIFTYFLCICSVWQIETSVFQILTIVLQNLFVKTTTDHTAALVRSTFITIKTPARVRKIMKLYILHKDLNVRKNYLLSLQPRNKMKTSFVKRNLSWTVFYFVIHIASIQALLYNVHIIQFWVAKEILKQTLLAWIAINGSK